MASIKISSYECVKACDKLMSLSKEKLEVEYDDTHAQRMHVNTHQIIIKHTARIIELCEFAGKIGVEVTIDHDDFALIGEYLTLPSQPGNE